MIVLVEQRNNYSIAKVQKNKKKIKNYNNYNR